MIKYALVVINEAPAWLYDRDDEWKSFVCEDFDEHVVLCGNRDMYECEEAVWWDKAKELIEEFDNNYNDDEALDFINDNKNEIAKDKLEDIVEAVRHLPSGKYTDDAEFIAEVAMILYPGLKLETSRINGYREWQDVIYEEDIVDINTLEDFYFGNVCEVALYEINYGALEEGDLTVDDLDTDNIEDYGEQIEGWDVMSDTDYWKEYHDDHLAAYFGYPKEEVMVLG